MIEIKANQGLNEIVLFLKNHPHCAKLVCTTCGGLFGFQQDLDLWLVQDKPDLASLINRLTIKDLEGVQDWPIFLEQIIDRIPEEMRGLIISAPIIPHIIAYQEEQRRLIKLQNLRDEQIRLINEERRQKWLKELEQRIVELSQISPVERLEVILMDESFPLHEFPDEWANLSEDYFREYNSVKLTHILKLLEKRVIYQKGAWKNLRTNLYRLRQRVYNREKGYR